MSRKKRKASKEKIRRLGEILKEFLIGNLEDEFPVRTSAGSLAAIPAVPVEEAPGEPRREAPEPDREDVEQEEIDEEAEAQLFDETKYYFELADVEYCVDVTITEILNEKLVGYDDPRKPPTLSGIFQMLFSEEDSLTKQAEKFEELISGYDDHVHIDDLQQAHNVMTEIVKELEDRSKQ